MIVNKTLIYYLF